MVETWVLPSELPCTPTLKDNSVNINLMNSLQLLHFHPKLLSIGTSALRLWTFRLTVLFIMWGRHHSIILHWGHQANWGVQVICILILLVVVLTILRCRVVLLTITVLWVRVAVWVILLTTLHLRWILTGVSSRPNRRNKTKKTTYDRWYSINYQQYNIKHIIIDGQFIDNW